MNHLLPTGFGLLLATLGTVMAGGPAETRQWRVAEFTFTARETHAGVPLGVRFGARFTGPDGSVYHVPGFWDGGQTWRVRFAPTMPGAWSYTTEAGEEESRQFVEAYVGETMRGNDPAQRVDVPLGDADELRLIVHDNGDDTRYDHADWADAELVKADGTAVYLDTIPPAAARQGHGELAFRTNIPGQPLRIADRTFERGLGTHARSEIRYPLDGTYARFRAWVGMDAMVKENGSVRFEVVLSRRSAARAGRRDAGLHGQSGAFTALPADGDNPLHRHGGFLRAAPDGHSLTYTDGTPFFWLGDTWWHCPSRLVPIDGSTNPAIPSAFQEMVQVRQRQGFTAVHMAFLGNLGGINPFEDAMRGPNLSPDYWRTVDRYMDYANANGLIPVIGLGWAGRPLNPDDWRLLWRHIVARYGAHAVTWLVCGEYNIRGLTDEKISENLALGQFIKDTDPYHRAMTIHPWAYSVDRRQAWDQPWYDFIMLQGGHGGVPPASLYLDAYHRQPAKPVLEAECQYEGIHDFTDANVREVAYRAIQAGSCGYTYGSQGLWYPTQNEQDTKTDNWGKPLVWWEALRRPGADQLAHLRKIYETVEWWRLQPRPDAIVPAPLASGTFTVVHDGIEQFAAATASNAHWSKIDDTDAQCIALHPRGRERTALAYPPVALPAVGPGERLLLVFAAGISAKANLADPKHPADGVRFAVAIDGSELWAEHRRDKNWTYQAIDLTPRAGTTVRLELVTGTGPEGNMNWDHALFRWPLILKVGQDNPAPGRDAYLAPPPRPVLAKADGDRAFVLYLPAGSGPVRSSLRGLDPAAAYTATWHNPRTGEALPAPALPPNHSALPAAPDAQDWLLILRKTNP
ncbi:MAG: DUF4038 domain-containing protein [Lentisphaeria bacterium]|jgi:hypothetical protein|nr:DUF4038 domain-containing protein [Lentisphaeria bacterium]